MAKLSLSGRGRPLFAAAAVAVGLVALPDEAEAFERQWHVGAHGGFSTVRQYSQNFSGGGGGLYLTYGLTDAINLNMQGGAYAHSGDVMAFQGTAGVEYVLDVLQWVPYVGFGVGVTDVWVRACDGAPELCGHDPRPTTAIPFGLDYQISRSFAVGLQGRQSFLFFGKDDNLGQHFEGGLRVEYFWGY